MHCTSANGRNVTNMVPHQTAKSPAILMVRGRFAPQIVREVLRKLNWLDYFLKICGKSTSYICCPITICHIHGIFACKLVPLWRCLFGEIRFVYLQEIFVEESQHPIVSMVLPRWQLAEFGPLLGISIAACLMCGTWHAVKLRRSKHFGAFCVYKVYNKGYNHLQSLSGILAANHLSGLITT